MPLWGVPFAVKDNIDVAGMPTTAACPAYAYAPARSAAVVERLVAAGAILVGKTNLDQFATGLVGVRTPYPVPRNAIDPALVPGGSSSGSAVAVARGLVAFALGTDTAGSGRVPAALNNIVGLKPTRGAISARGVVPACRSLDCVSVFSGTVADAWVVAVGRRRLRRGGRLVAARADGRHGGCRRWCGSASPIRRSLKVGSDVAGAAFAAALSTMPDFGAPLTAGRPDAVLRRGGAPLRGCVGCRTLRRDPRLHRGAAGGAPPGDAADHRRRAAALRRRRLRRAIPARRARPRHSAGVATTSTCWWCRRSRTSARSTTSPPIRSAPMPGSAPTPTSSTSSTSRRSRCRDPSGATADPRA